MENNFDLIFNEPLNRRDKLQELFDASFRKKDKEKLREYYKILRRLERENDSEKINRMVDISSVTENLTAAFDILTWETGISFLFCGNKTSCISGNQKALSGAVLNLLSNAYLYGTGQLVTVKTIEKDGYVYIEVQSTGRFEKEWGNGLLFVKRVCEENGGRLFIERDLIYTRAIMIFKSTGLLTEDGENTDFYDLITDRLSPVYAELFGMEYN